jgi:methylamine dehydrogenase heavy chain
MSAILSAMAFLTATPGHAELPVETLTTEQLPANAEHRLYIGDPAMPHLLDGRLHVVDGTTMRYLGMIGTGFSGQSVVTPDGQHIVIATTYHSRGQRGTRSDVVEVYRTRDLAFDHEIEIPAKHVQGLAIRGALSTTEDSRFLLVQNATPATSISIVDLQARRFIAEVPNPGCYGVLPWNDGSRRFSSVCGDGTLSTFTLDAEGRAGPTSVSARFFDPDVDPIFMHHERMGDQLLFVSYHGQVVSVRLAGDAPSFAKPWPLVNAAEQKQGWRPGGYQLFTVDAGSGRLIVGMHAKGTEGSHKNPAQQLWVVDLKTQRRSARLPGHDAIAMTVTGKTSPRLVLLNGGNNTVWSFDLTTPNGLTKPLKVSAPVGETPVLLGSAS